MLRVEILEKRLGFEITAELAGLGSVVLCLVLMLLGSLLFPDRGSREVGG